MNRALIKDHKGRTVLADLKTREVGSTYAKHVVVDILRENDLALCVCVLCGQTWNEGAATLPICFS